MNNNTPRSIRHVSLNLAKRGANRGITRHYPPAAALVKWLDLFDVFDAVAVRPKTETVGIQTISKTQTNK